MIDFRYHIATIIAMFLMLGIGIVVGSATNLGPAVIKQQTSTIQSLSGKLDNVLQESARDHSLLKQNEEALTELVPRLVGGKLAGKKIAIIRTGDYADAAASAEQAIAAAGGAVVSETTLTGRLQLLDDTQRAGILRDLKLPADTGDDQSYALILKPLMQSLRFGDTDSGNARSSMDVLRQDSVVNTSGDYSSAVSAVVIIGGSLNDDDADDPSADALISGLTDPNSTPAITVVGCEPFDCVSSSMPAFNKAGIASVDCIDLPVGALDLPFALRGDETVSYGVKSTATRLLPRALDSTTGAQAAATRGTAGQ